MTACPTCLAYQRMAAMLQQQLAAAEARCARQEKLLEGNFDRLVAVVNPQAMAAMHVPNPSQAAPVMGPGAPFVGHTPMSPEMEMLAAMADAVDDRGQPVVLVGGQKVSLEEWNRTSAKLDQMVNGAQLA